MKRSLKILSALQGLVLLVAIGGVAKAVDCKADLPASNPDFIYADHGNGTVTDTRTGLMWKRCAEGLEGPGCLSGSAQRFNWAAAHNQAASSVFANYSDWRVPNAKELSTLVEECRFNAAINNTVFPNSPTDGACTWSSSPYFVSDLALVVCFYEGGATWDLRFGVHYVRLVREGL